jgi:hypothetical protein
MAGSKGEAPEVEVEVEEAPVEIAEEVAEVVEDAAPVTLRADPDTLDVVIPAYLSSNVRESILVELATETPDSPVGHSTSLDAYTVIEEDQE